MIFLWELINLLSHHEIKIFLNNSFMQFFFNSFVLVIFNPNHKNVLPLVQDNPVYVTIGRKTQSQIPFPTDL